MKCKHCAVNYANSNVGKTHSVISVAINPGAPIAYVRIGKQYGSNSRSTLQTAIKAERNLRAINLLSFLDNSKFLHGSK